MNESLDVAVVGAGAAGLMAIIQAGREAAARELNGCRIVGFDGAARIGAKILISGGGRCNVTHDVVEPDDYYGSSRNAVARVLRSFTVEETVAFFAELGISLKTEETGKLFPVTNRAADVVDALLAAVRSVGALIRTGERVTAVSREGDAFVIETAAGSRAAARRLILATGGLSVPKTGSDGAGYSFAETFGHSLTERWPALVPLLLPRDHWLTGLRGITIPAALELRSSTGKRLRREEGSLLFTHFGLSGPLVLDMSRHWIAASRKGQPSLHLSVLPGSSGPALDDLLRDAAERHPRERVSRFLARTLPDRLAEALVEETAGGQSPVLGQLRREQRKSLATSLTELRLPVTGDRGFAYAEVTAGGIPLDEIDTTSMESRRTPGLFLCGEICDVDGRIGGYNFQWAWASGRLAGRAAVASLHEKGGM